ncbi:MFS transporter [Bordetella genomosp. 1]|uniref:MFS transporter n=1 Tax=Bordetella genomosp. 1 TaxID=1395607 RepID=A0A261S8E4_9BORD|nr:MFS transporter [Bordetella genomosp. 1]OZI33050.1 MFS transporter [Bordetella genomosp. 1]
MSAGWRLGAVGFGLIAVCYGLARFAFGLFLPRINADLQLSASLGALMSGGAFLGYCLAIGAGAALTERMGPRFVAVAAAGVAAAGMLGIALAPAPGWLAAAVLLAGSSTGLASPPLAAAVALAVPAGRQDAVNTLINAGTGAGVLLSGPAALALGSDWRLAFGGFTALAVLVALATFRVVPRGGRSAHAAVAALWPLNGALKRLVAAAFLCGASSTALWSFGSQLVALRLDWGGTGAGLLWMVIGAAGIAGAGAGRLIGRVGMARVHVAFLAAMAAGIALVGQTGATPAWTLAGAALFGVAYIMLTGVYLVWGVGALPQRPAAGLMVGFLALAVGQTAGAPLFGLLMTRLSAGHAAAAFAALALAAACVRTAPVRQRSL